MDQCGAPKSAATLRQKIEAAVEYEPTTGCWLWARGFTGNGYGALRHKGYPQGAHRTAWAAYRGPIPDGLQVLHRCDTPACVNPGHLFLGTNDDNMADMAKKGRAASPRKGARGASHPRAQLTDADVAAIRSAYVPRGPDCTTAALAAAFGITKRHVRAVATGERWRRS